MAFRLCGENVLPTSTLDDLMTLQLPMKQRQNTNTLFKIIVPSHCQSKDLLVLATVWILDMCTQCTTAQVQEKTGSHLMVQHRLDL